MLFSPFTLLLLCGGRGCVVVLPGGGLFGEGKKMSKRLKVLGLVGVLLASLALPVEAKTDTIVHPYCTTTHTMWENSSYIYGSTATGPEDPCVSVKVLVRVFRYGVYTDYYTSYFPVLAYKRLTSADQSLVYTQHSFYYRAGDMNYPSSYKIWP